MKYQAEKRSKSMLPWEVASNVDIFLPFSGAFTRTRTRPSVFYGRMRERERGRERFGYSLLVDQMVGRDVSLHAKVKFVSDKPIELAVST